MDIYVTNDDHQSHYWVTLLFSFIEMVESIAETVHYGKQDTICLLCLSLFVDINFATLLNDPDLDQLGPLNLGVKVYHQCGILVWLFGIVYILI
jgi:hypothetical protein